MDSLECHLIDEEYEAKTSLVVEDRSPRMDLLRMNSEPVTVEKIRRVKSLLFESGSVSTTVDVPRRGFSPGETIPIHVRVDNQTSRQIRITSILQRVDTFTESGGKQKITHSPIA